MKTKTRWFFAITILALCLNAHAEQNTAASLGDEAGWSPVLTEGISTPQPVRKSAGIPEVNEIIFWASPHGSSPSYSQTVANAIVGIEGRLGSVGTGTSEFRVIPVGERAETWMVTLTTFPYWRGTVQPASSLERGNRLNSGFHKISRTLFSLAQVSADQKSSDSIGGTSTLRFPSTSFATINYSTLRFGIYYGPDGIKGTADDVRYTSGPPTALVNELYVNFAKAYEASDILEIDGSQGIKAYMLQNRPFTVTAGFTVSGTRYERSVSFFPEATPPPVAPLLSATANPASIVRGESSVLTINAAGATNVSVSGIGSVAFNATLTVTPTETTGYIIVAAGVGGGSTQSVVWVTVTAPPQIAGPTVSVGVTPNAIRLGENATIGYNTTGATNVFISGIGNVELSGSRTVTPTETTLYVITAVGPGGRISSKVLVTVVPTQPEPGAFTVTAKLEGLPSRVDVFPATHLKLVGSVTNSTLGPLNLVDPMFQVSVNTTNNWARLVSAGQLVVVPQGGVWTTEYTWDTGKADPSTTWYFRLSGTVSGTAFNSETVSVRVIPNETIAVATPLSLRIERGVRSVRLSFTARPGTYNLEESLQASGPWTDTEIISVGTEQTVSRLFSTDEVPKKLWRVRKRL